MGKMETVVNKMLKSMHNAKEASGKGTPGELAVFAVMEGYYQKHGGILIHSYEHKVVNSLPGNIKRDKVTGELKVENTGNMTEVDVLYISPYRVIPIEVKAYKARKIILTNDSISGCCYTEKSPIHQNEMHARHIYRQIYQALPSEDPNYFVPIVVFVDEATIVDNRSSWQKGYIHKAVLDNVENVISSLDKPLEYRLDLQAVEDRIKQIMIGNEKYLPLRYPTGG